MTSPFDREDGSFFVLVNDAGQHSLWPVQVAVPDGWTMRSGPATRAECLDHIAREWTDLRPAAHGGGAS